jgi:hypothetical protein
MGLLGVARANTAVGVSLEPFLLLLLLQHAKCVTPTLRYESGQGSCPCVAG